MTNNVTIIGEAASPFQYSHSSRNEAFYSFTLSAKRNSGVYDHIPAIISEHLIDTSQDMTGQTVGVSGQFRSLNVQGDDGKSHLKLYIFVQEIGLSKTDREHVNRISLDGYICRQPLHRITALKQREIADLMLAVNRTPRTDYIPCICWGGNARLADSLDIGTRIYAEGRIQSRKYIKRISETEAEERTAYEVSIKTMEVINTEEEQDDGH